ncbi:MAG: hypothetical protein DMG40_00880 [Acidobacteria bacterium]|nr:MAG: hypothetical protein DMG40_00880 [Acidobacteriota bacterium]
MSAFQYPVLGIFNRDKVEGRGSKWPAFHYNVCGVSGHSGALGKRELSYANDRSALAFVFSTERNPKSLF